MTDSDKDEIELTAGLLSVEQRHVMRNKTIGVTPPGTLERRHQRDRREIPGCTPSNSFRPQRERRHNEVEITVYCARDRLDEIMQYRHVFGDTDFTRSLSRFLTAGCHWMADHHAEVSAANAMATEVKMLEQERDALRATISRLALPRGKNVMRTKRKWWKRWLGC